MKTTTKRFNLTNYLLSGITVGMMTMIATAPIKENSSGLEQLVRQKPAITIENKIKTSVLYKLAFQQTNKLHYEPKNNIFHLPIEEIVKEKQEIRRIAEENKKTIYTPTDSEILGLSQIIYAEAASQSNEAWSDIIQVIKNRKDSRNYPNSIEEVIYQPGAFSCIDDKNNNNWNQVTGKTPMNGYEKMVFSEIKEEVRNELMNTKITLGRENVIAYHDWSIHKPKDSYWNSLEKTHEEGKLIFYAPKETLQKSTITYIPNTKENNINNLYENNIIDASNKFGLLAKTEKINDDKIIDFEEARGLLAKATQIKKAA
ncbi:cell wall hydrolase [Candidatus Pacearchaeota archaeon]|nr:cell wall hydrolase [Candidatus Pacearchaeota archaeon]